MRRDPRVARVFTFHHTSQRKAFGHVHGAVFKGMHRQIGMAFLKGDLEFFDKQALAPDFAQRSVQDLVTLGGHTQDSNFVSTCLQQILQMVGLPQSQTALSGGDGEVNGAQNRVGVDVFGRVNASMGSLMVFPRHS